MAPMPPSLIFERTWYFPSIRVGPSWSSMDGESLPSNGVSRPASLPRHRERPGRAAAGPEEDGVRAGPSRAVEAPVERELRDGLIRHRRARARERERAARRRGDDRAAPERRRRGRLRGTDLPEIAREAERGRRYAAEDIPAERDR